MIYKIYWKDLIDNLFRLEGDPQYQASVREDRFLAYIPLSLVSIIY